MTCDNKFEYLCKTLQQKLDGGWSEWTEWSACNRQYIRTRSHECSNPAPFCGGNDCPGSVIGQRYVQVPAYLIFVIHVHLVLPFPSIDPCMDPSINPSIDPVQPFSFLLLPQVIVVLLVLPDLKSFGRNSATQKSQVQYLHAISNMICWIIVSLC